VKKEDEAQRGIRWHTKTVWSWLSIRAKTAIGMTIAGACLTLFFGQYSWQNFVVSISSRVNPWPYWLLDWIGNTIVLTGVALLVLKRLNRKSNASPRSGVSETYRLMDDVALQRGQQDELGFGKFVSKLANTVVLPERANSLVVGLEAPWGSGKSSALNLLQQALTDHPDKPVVIRFNPWLVSGNDGISRAFFAQFSESLRNAGERQLAERLIAYGEMLEELMPPAARLLPRLPFLRRVAGRIPELDIGAVQEQLSSLVLRRNTPIVIFVDDIDRLRPEDVTSIFHLVKAVAAFPRVAYILAFDPLPIDAALTRDGMHGDGRAFRDKIVQANIPLPRIAYAAKKRFLTSRLFQRAASWKFVLLEPERKLLGDAIPLVLTALKTPRDIKRVLNKTLMSAEGLRNEVNIADVLVFETIHAMFPKVVDLIRQRPEALNASDHELDVAYDASIHKIIDEEIESKNREEGEKIRHFTSIYPGKEVELRPLLQFLFHSIFEDTDREPAAMDLRISNRTNLLKLLYQDLAGEMSAAAAVSFLADSRDRTPQLAETVEANSLAAWLSHVVDFVPGADIPEPENLVTSVAEAVNSQFAQWRSDSSEDAGYFIIRVLDALPEDDEKWNVLTALVARREFTPTSQRVLTSLMQDVGLWKSGTYLGVANLASDSRQKRRWLVADKLDRLRKQWVENLSATNISTIIARLPAAGVTLFRWHQWSDVPHEVRQGLEQAFEDAETGARFIKLFPPGIGVKGLENLLTPIAKEHLKNATRHASVEKQTGDRMFKFLTLGTDDDDF
jgi:hypothetical protein